jgi:hypothetical protein
VNLGQKGADWGQKDESASGADSRSKTKPAARQQMGLYWRGLALLQVNTAEIYYSFTGDANVLPFLGSVELPGSGSGRSGLSGVCKLEQGASESLGDKWGKS